VLLVVAIAMWLSLTLYSPKDVDVSSPEVYGSVSEKFARKKYGVWKTQGGW